jgi:RNA polymerase sigma factor (sigma-70 family)
VNLLGRHYRDEERQLRAYARTGVDPVLDTADVSDARLDAEGFRRRLAEALAELRSEERDVLLLFAWAELDYAEIAEALEVPIGTVRSRLSRAREHVRIALTAKPETEVTGERA